MHKTPNVDCLFLKFNCYKFYVIVFFYLEEPLHQSDPSPPGKQYIYLFNILLSNIRQAACYISIFRTNSLFYRTQKIIHIVGRMCLVQIVMQYVGPYCWIYENQKWNAKRKTAMTVVLTLDSEISSYIRKVELREK